MNDKSINGLVITGLLAVLGTVAGGVVKGYWDTNLAEKDFQSRLIMRALEPDSVEQRVTSLEFLVKANLISDPAVRRGLQQVLEEGGASVPQFVPVGRNPNLERGVQNTGSAREGMLEKYPTLEGKNVALIGFRVRHGDIIDAVTPIYAEVTPSMELVGEYEGQRIGGTGGGETVLKKPGFVVTGIEVQRGWYFGRSEVVHFQVTWQRLGRQGLEADSTVASQRLGGGNHARIDQPPKRFKAAPNAFLSDFHATVSRHTSGELFLNDIEVSETVVVVQ